MAVRIMGEKQLNTKLTDDEVKYIVAFLNSLNGEMKSFALPVLPPSTQKTPRPDRH